MGTRLGVPGLLQWPVVDDSDAVTIEDLPCFWRGEERVVVLPDLPPARLDRLPLLGAMRSLAAAAVERDASGEAVLLCERHRQFEDVGAAAVGEAVPVEVRGCQSYVDHGVDLCAELAFDLGQLGRSEERGALARHVDEELVRVGVEQRGHVGLGGGRAPAVLGRVADELEVDAESP
jgi:hypothetical protein